MYNMVSKFKVQLMEMPKEKVLLFGVSCVQRMLNAYLSDSTHVDSARMCLDEIRKSIGSVPLSESRLSEMMENMASIMPEDDENSDDFCASSALSSLCLLIDYCFNGDVTSISDMMYLSLDSVLHASGLSEDEAEKSDLAADETRNFRRAISVLSAENTPLSAMIAGLQSENLL